MSQFDKQTATKFITIFSGAIRNITFYPASHPSIRLPLIELQRLLFQRLSQSDSISWGVMDGAMFFEEQLLVPATTAITELISRMEECSISRISLLPGLELDELEGFIRLFSARGNSCSKLTAALAESGISHILLTEFRHQNEESGAEDSPTVSNDECLAAYDRALNAIRGICNDIEQGRIPNSKAILQCVEQMAEITLHDPSTLLGLSMIKDYDNYTFNHCINVGILSMALGAAIGLEPNTVKTLGVAGQLHDIGKIMISKKILNKPGKLTSEEFAEMKRHPEMGSKIINEMEGISEQISRVVLGHHLYYNRLGYPDWARALPFDQLIDIIAIADTYDAMTTLRVYQKPFTPRATLDELRKMSGASLDSRLVASFTTLMGKYPVGTVVRLDSNEIAMVYHQNSSNEDAPHVRVISDPAGNQLKEALNLDLSREGSARIAAVIDPFLKNINLNGFIGIRNQLAAVG